MNVRLSLSEGSNNQYIQISYLYSIANNYLVKLKSIQSGYSAYSYGEIFNEILKGRKAIYAFHNLYKLSYIIKIRGMKNINPNF
jgi:hypothetical protein